MWKLTGIVEPAKKRNQQTLIRENITFTQNRLLKHS